MKHLKDLFEKRFERVQPKTLQELESIIENIIDKFGNDADLNFIDTSKITSMSYLFANSEFNGDISKWDVSNVTNMFAMFAFSDFNGDISKWDTSSVTSMERMFRNSIFNKDISKWNVDSVVFHLDFNFNSKLEDKHCPKFK